MLTTRQVAEILNISYTTAFRLIEAGKIKAVKVGGTYRIDEKEVERIKREGTE